MDDEVGDAVEGGLLTVEYHELRAEALGVFGKSRRRIDDEGRAGGQHQVAGLGVLPRAAHGVFRHRLAERDGGALDDAAAKLAGFYPFALAELCL